MGHLQGQYFSETILALYYIVEWYRFSLEKKDSVTLHHLWSFNLICTTKHDVPISRKVVADMQMHGRVQNRLRDGRLHVCTSMSLDIYF